MARNTEQTKIEVLLDGRQASDQLKDLSKQSAALRLELKRAFDANDAKKVANTEWELSKLDSRMKLLRKESVNVKAVLDNLSGATMTELRQAISSVNSRLNGKAIKKNSMEWNELVGIKRKLASQEKQLRAEISGTDSVLRKSSGILNQHNILLGVVGATLFKIQGEARKSLQSYNNFEDSFQNLSALTGLTGDSLEYLKQQAKDTSTATLEGGVRIRQGATNILDAYTMIGSQRPELLKNKEALHEVTVEAIILSEAAKMDIQPAAQALTNSLNQFNAESSDARRYINVLAAGSQAGAGNINYLSQAIEKSGTTAKLMGLNFEELVALIETAAPNFKEAAVAGNSLDKVMLEMKAKQIGYRDGIFDVNVALDELIDRFNTGETSVDIFGKEHAKMVEVLVAGRAKYAEYLQAVSGTNKAIEQAATNTDTNKVKTQQYLNELEKVRIEIGEKLTPGIGLLTRGGTSLLRVFGALVDIANNYGISLGALVVTITILLAKTKILNALDLARNAIGKDSVLVGKAKILGMNAQIAALKLQTIFTGSATMAEKRHIVAIEQKIVAMKAANATIAKTPWGLIATGAALAIGFIVDLVKNTNNLTESQKRLSDINKQYTDTLREQTGQMEMLFTKLKTTNSGTEERIKLVDRLAEIIPDVIDKQKLYNASLQDIKQTEKEYRSELEKRIRLQEKEAQFTDLVKQQMDIEDALVKAKARLDASRKKNDEIINGFDSSPDARVNALKAVGKVEEEVSMLETRLEEIKKLKDNIDISSSPDYSGPILLPGVKIENNNWRDEMEKDILEELKKTERLKKENEKRLKDQKEFREKVLFEAKTALEQEDILYEKRLKDAGLASKKEIELESKDALVLQALYKEHQANIYKIKTETETKIMQERQKAIDKEIQDLKDTNARELSELHIKHNEELSAENLNTSEKAKLKKKHREEELKLSAEHARKLITLMQGMLDGSNVVNLDLADKVLSPGERKKLEKAILEAKETLSKLKIGDEKKDVAILKSSPVDVLGMTPEKWDLLFQNLRDGKFGVDEIGVSVQALTNLWGVYNNYMVASEQRQLKDFEKSSKKKRATLDKQLDAGQISQEQYNARVSELDAELDAKKAEIENKQAKRQKEMAIVNVITNTALAIMKIWADVPKFDFGATTMALTALVTALGAAQIATIAATPLPGAEKGGYIDVVRSQDGKRFRAKDNPDNRGFVDSPTVLVGESGREFVVSNDAVMNPTVKPILDVIDTAQRSGNVDKLDLTRYLFVPGRSRGGTVVDSSDSSAVLSADPRFIELLDENIRMMKILANKEIIFKWYGSGGFKEKFDKSNMYDKNTSVGR
ncbi:phage tail tape measure protein [Sanguibacteroides sp. AM78-02pH3A]|uniref:Phage tail tape measure protein domain-containing protein n=2 Tax=Sanguibacteroides justesenii TaxID=1547597 RepID=A0AB34R5J3_9PORP|nr:phage tail tape measure protein [Sanguibacteroides sp. AM78-02pH3A]KIO45469.1 hypothetical protein IE90_08680 [Sanguibacteroides justesenii]